MKEFLKTHRIAMLLTLFVGTVIGLPSILAPLAIGSAYLGIPFLPLSDEYFYMSRIREVLDGHLWTNAPYVYEYKSLLSPTFPVNEWLYAIPALVFGLIPVVVASKFVLPALLFVFSYFLFLSVFRRDDETTRWSAIAGSLVIVLGTEFVNYSYVFGILDGTKYPIENGWTRLVNPVMGGVQLLAFLFLIAEVWNRGWRYAHIAAGIVLAGMVGYFFSFGLALSMLATLFLFALARKEYNVARALFTTGALSIFLDAWWWYKMLFSLGGEEGAALAMRNGMFFTHEPVLNKALLASTVVVGALFCYVYFFLRRREYIREYLFAFALVVAGWIAFNEQVITGRQVWHHHFMQYTVPMGVAAIIIAGYYTFRHLRYLWIFGTGSLATVCIAYGLYAVTAYTAPWDIDRHIHVQRAALYTTWFQQNAPKDCVVLANPNDIDVFDEERLIPTFSHCNTYTVDFVPFGITRERIEHNYLLQLRMRGVSAAGVREHLLGQGVWIRQYFSSDWHQVFGYERGMEPWILDRIDRLTEAYQHFMKVPLETQIKKYRVDYILSEGPLPRKLLAELPDLKLVASPGMYRIYQFTESGE